MQSRYLELICNNVKDITPLRELNQLELLNLSNNRISDVSPLSELEKLLYLDLSQNYIKDVSPIRRQIDLIKIFRWVIRNVNYL